LLAISKLFGVKFVIQDDMVDQRTIVEYIPRRENISMRLHRTTWYHYCPYVDYKEIVGYQSYHDKCLLTKV